MPMPPKYDVQAAVREINAGFVHNPNNAGDHMVRHAINFGQGLTEIIRRYHAPHEAVAKTYGEALLVAGASVKQLVACPNCLLMVNTFQVSGYYLWTGERFELPQMFQD